MIKKISPYANWRQNYEEKDVDQNFLDKFAYFELFGPTGHFLTKIEIELLITTLIRHTHDTIDYEFKILQK